MVTILHIGFPKTGTTTLQRIFRGNAGVLNESGLIYPVVGKDFKQRELKHLMDREPQTAAENAIASLRTKIDAEAARLPHAHLLLSNEGLTVPPTSRITRRAVANVRDFMSRWGERSG